MAIQGLKNLFFKDEVVFSFMSGFTGYNCPRRGGITDDIYFICDLQMNTEKTYSPLLQLPPRLKKFFPFPFLLL